MTARPVNPTLKAVLEYGPLIAFFAAYLWLKDRVFLFHGTEYHGFILVTAAFVPLFLVCTLALWKLSGELSKMQLVTAVIVTVMGGMTVWFNDPRFFKMKPTIAYLIFAGLLGFGLLRGTSYLQVLIGEMLPLTRTGWMILTRRLALFFLGLAVLNEIVWRTQSEETWVWFKVIGLTVATFGFFLMQARLFKTHGADTGSS